MVDLAGEFGVALTAFTGVDKASLKKAEKDIGAALARPKTPVKVSYDVSAWQKQTAKLQTDSQRNIDRLSRQLWGAAGGQVRSLAAIRKASVPAAKETGNIARYLGNIKSHLKESWHLDGFGRAVEQFREGRKALGELREHAEGLSKLFGPLEGLTALGTLAGIGAAFRSFATTGAETGRTARTIGVSANVLQNWRGAGELQGVSSEQTTAALSGLAQTMHAARIGLPEGDQARQAAAQLGLDLNESEDSFLKHLADAMKGRSAGVQRNIAAAFGVSDMLPLLRNGSGQISADMQEAAANEHMSPEDIKNAQELERAFTGAFQAVEGLKNAIAGELAPELKPLLDEWRGWMNEVKTDPDKLQAVTTGTEILAGAVGIGLTGAFVKLIAATNAWWLLPATRLLLSPYGLIGTALGALTYGGMKGQEKALADQGVVINEYGDVVGTPSSTPSNPNEHGMGALGRWLSGTGLGHWLWGGNSPGSGAVRLPGGDLSGLGHVGIAAPNDAYFNWGSIGGAPATARHYATSEEGVQAVRDLLLAKYRNMTLAKMIETYAPPNENDTPLLIRRAAKMLGMDPGDTPNMDDPEMMRRLVTAFIANEHGGALPLNLSQGDIDKALGFKPTSGSLGGAYGVPGAVMNYAETGAMGPPGSNLVQITTPDGKKYTVNKAAAPAFEGFVADLERAGYQISSIGGYNMRDKVGGGSLSEHAWGNAIDINPTANPYGGARSDLPANIHDLAAKWGLIWGGDWSTGRDPMHFQWGGPNAGVQEHAEATEPEYEPADTTHHVVVEFVNAPQGMRSGLRYAQGPSDLTVKTNMAFQLP